MTGGFHALRYGWDVDMDWEGGFCYVTISRPFQNGAQEVMHTYMLRLSFEYYPIDQPGVIFVNPETRQIGAAGEFECWWPNIDGNPFINIQINKSDPAKSYLCFQWTHEFSETHGALPDNDPKKWDPAKHDVVGVVRIVHRALSSTYYKGYRK